MSGSKRLLPLIGLYAGLAMLAFVLLFPVLWVLSISLKSNAQIFVSSPLWLWEPTFAHYIEVLTKKDFGSSLLNSLVTSLSAVALSVILGLPAAYAMARMEFRGRSAIYYTLLAMRMLPGIAILIPMFLLFDEVGLKSSVLSLVLAYTSFCLPLVVWVMRGFFAALPVEIEEAARVDGAGRWRTFMLIGLPLARPGVVAIGTLCLLTAWNDFLFAAVLTNKSTQTLPVLVAGYNNADDGVLWGPLAAAGMLVVLPVFLLAFAAQKHLVAGLSAGAAKG